MLSNVEQKYIPTKLKPRLPSPPRYLFNALPQEIFDMILSYAWDKEPHWNEVSSSK